MTPLEHAPAALARFAGLDDLWLKREDLHELGMFKWRAALPVVRELGQRAVVTSSTGNHGAAVAWGSGAGWMVDRVPGLLGEHDDPSGFTCHHPPVADAWRAHAGWRVPRSALLALLSSPQLAPVRAACRPGQSTQVMAVVTEGP